MVLLNKYSNKIKLGYDFSVDNDLSTFEYNDVNATFIFNKLETKFNFIEEMVKRRTNIFENSIVYNLDDNNSFLKQEEL